MRWQWGIGGLNRKTPLLLLAAIAIRLLVMPITIHGDIFHIWGVVTLSLQGIWDPFYYAVINYQNIAISTFDVYYPPAAYVIYSSFLIILNLFSSSLVGWLQFPRELVLLARDVPLNVFIQDLRRPDLFWNIFLLKAPNFIYEAVIVVGIFKLVKPNRRLKLLIPWLFNPVVIYSAYMMGQIDLLTAALVVWSAVAAVGGKKLASMTLLVVGTMVKVLPLVLIVPSAFLLGKSWGERIFLGLYSVAIFVGFNLPFAHNLDRLRIAYFPPIMPGFFDLAIRPDAMVAMAKLLTAVGVSLWLGWKIVKNQRRLKPQHFPQLIGLVLLLFFSAYRGALLNHFVVLVPFLILFWVKERGAALKLMVFSGLLFLTHIYTRPLMGELFTPLGIDWLTNFPSSREMVAPWFKYEHLSLTTGAILSGWLLIEAIKNYEKNFSVHKS